MTIMEDLVTDSMNTAAPDGTCDGTKSQPKPSRGGAPRNNTNSVKHGARSQRWGVTLAKLGDRFAPAYFDVCRLRKALERLVAERLGRVTLRERCRIQTLCRLEMSARASEMAIRDNPKMTAEELRTHRTMINQWSLQRDNILAELLGDAPSPSDPMAGYLAALANAQAARVASRTQETIPAVEATGEPTEPSVKE